MTSPWVRAVDSALANMEITFEQIKFGESEALPNTQACQALASAMSRTVISFVGQKDDSANWVTGEPFHASSDQIFMNDRGSAGPGVYLHFPVYLNETSLELYVTSLGIEDQYSNSFGLLATSLIDETEIIPAQKEKSKKIEITGSAFRSAHLLNAEDLPLALQEVDGAADLVGELLSMYGGEIAEAFFFNGANALLANPEESFDAIQTLWTKAISILNSIQVS